MRVLIFGAGGRVGKAIAIEALKRGHSVNGVVRGGTIDGIPDMRFRPIAGDVTNLPLVTSLIEANDVTASAIGPKPGEDPSVIPAAAKVLIEAAKKAGRRRLVVVGGAGSLETAPGQMLMNEARFPAEWKPLAQAHAAALDQFRALKEELDWTYVSPAEIVEEGSRTGRFRVGGDMLPVDPEGKSHISIPDFAVAFVDELGRGGHLKKRVSVGY
ncbi:MAG TPA: NAD(P)H-binding protein [Thermoplasmata archaeon]|nr:NAD(P)H-binding protein [Thermoplasmata archaeon]